MLGQRKDLILFSKWVRRSCKKQFLSWKVARSHPSLGWIKGHVSGWGKDILRLKRDDNFESTAETFQGTCNPTWFKLFATASGNFFSAQVSLVFKFHFGCCSPRCIIIHSYSPFTLSFSIFTLFFFCLNGLLQKLCLLANEDLNILI